MTRWLLMVSALTAMGLTACGPRESDASPQASGHPGVQIRPAQPRDGSGTASGNQPGNSGSASTPAPSRDPNPAPATATAPAKSGAPGAARPMGTPPVAPAERRAEVFFKEGPAGFVTASTLDADLATYPFEAAGTFGSVGLARAILESGRAPVAIDWQGQRKAMYAVKLSESTIDLTAYADPSLLAIARSYLPLVTGATFKYKGRGGLEDTTCVMRTQRIGFVNWHYLVETPEGKPAQLARHFLCRGAFQKGAGGVIFIEADEIADLDRESPGQRQVLLGLPPTRGWTVRHTYGAGRDTFTLTVEAFEQVVVPAGTYEECARIRSEPSRGLIPAVTYWLAPGIGMIKVAVDDGGVLELASHELP